MVFGEEPETVLGWSWRWWLRKTNFLRFFPCNSIPFQADIWNAMEGIDAAGGEQEQSSVGKVVDVISYLGYWVESSWVEFTIQSRIKLKWGESCSAHAGDESTTST